MFASRSAPCIPGLVSTVIPVFNRPEMLTRAVQSVLDQTYRSVEVIIVDDGSTDSTPDVARQLVQQYPEQLKFHQKSNSGPGPTREAGRLLARGEFLQYLDSDDRLLPNKFSDQVQALNDSPQSDIAYGITRLVDENGNVLADPFKWTDQVFSGLFPGLLVDRWWCTHTPLYRRTLTDRIGSWCDMRWSQDWEYDARAAALGAQLIHCGTHVSEHVHHTGERQTSGAAWTTDPVRLRNRVQLLTVLWEKATVVGVAATAPERQHFARWAFRIARQCAAAGLRAQAVTLLSIASASSNKGRGSRGISAYTMLSKILGYRAVGQVATAIERRRQGAGGSTMPQSFSGQMPNE
ncbi:MAG: glycosyltransferase [Planctomycetaceae bacterium]